MGESSDPYDRDEKLFRTDGRDACHWCHSRPQAWVWGPYGTRTCDHCEQMIDAGRMWEVAEEVAPRMVVWDTWHTLDLEQWREREHTLITRWIELRTERRPAESTPG